MNQKARTQPERSRSNQNSGDTFSRVQDIDSRRPSDQISKAKAWFKLKAPSSLWLSFGHLIIHYKGKSDLPSEEAAENRWTLARGMQTKGPEFPSHPVVQWRFVSHCRDCECGEQCK